MWNMKSRWWSERTNKCHGYRLKWHKDNEKKKIKMRSTQPTLLIKIHAVKIQSNQSKWNRSDALLTNNRVVTDQESHVFNWYTTIIAIIELNIDKFVIELWIRACRCCYSAWIQTSVLLTPVGTYSCAWRQIFGGSRRNFKNLKKLLRFLWGSESLSRFEERLTASRSTSSRDMMWGRLPRSPSKVTA